MKKIIATIFVLMFLISTVAVIADDHNDNNDNSGRNPNIGGARGLGAQKPEDSPHPEDNKAWEKLDPKIRGRFYGFDNSTRNRLLNLSDDDFDKIKVLRKNEISAFANMTEDQIKMRLGNLKLVNVKLDSLFKKRVINSTIIEDAKDRFEEAKEKFKLAQEEFKKEKDAFMQALKQGSEQAAIGHAKSVLTSSADIIINVLEKVKTKIQDNENLNSTDAASMIANIDAKILLITNAKANVLNATTKQDVKAAGMDIINAWNKMKEDVKINVGEVINSKVNEVLVRSEQLQSRLENALAALKDKGINTTTLDPMIANFTAKVSDAKDKFTLAQQKFELAKDLKKTNQTDQMNTLINDARSLASQAQGDLKDAHAILVEILKEVRHITGNTSIIISNDDDENVTLVENITNEAA